MPGLVGMVFGMVIGMVFGSIRLGGFFSVVRALLDGDFCCRAAGLREASSVGLGRLKTAAPEDSNRSAIAAMARTLPIMRRSKDIVARLPVAS